MSDKKSFKDLISLYQIYSNDNRTYNNIVWQFPTALITANIIMVTFLWDGQSLILPFLLPVIPILNFALLHALFKLGHNQAAIIKSLQAIEAQLKKEFSSDNGQIPNFKKNRNPILSWSSRNVINWTLFIFNCFYLLAAIIFLYPLIWP